MQIIVVAGTGRSGTTWIGDVLTSCRSSLGIYEPLRANMVPEVPTNGLPGEHPCTYLRSTEDHPDWRDFFGRLFDGSITNGWIRQDWAQGRSMLPPKLLPGGLRRKFTEIAFRFQRHRSQNCIVKGIRANLLLDWLSANFPVRVVYLVRHPCAVVGSRLRLKWNDVLDEILSQSNLIEDFLQPYLAMIRQAKTPLQRMTTHWCIENKIPLAQLPRNPHWIPLSYEECLQHPEKTFAGLFEKLNLSPSSGTQRRIHTLVSMPAPDAGKDHPWHHPLSESEGAEVLEICRQFHIDIYGAANAPPDFASHIHTDSHASPIPSENIHTRTQRNMRAALL